MSLQAGQNVVRFPSTRLLDADYGSILPNISKKLTVLQQLQRLLNEKGVSPHTNYSVTPHHPIIKSVDGRLSILERETAIESEIREQISLLERSITCQEQRILGAEPIVKTLLEAAKTDPASAAHVLLSTSSEDEGNLVVMKKRAKLRCSSGKDCASMTLPYSRYCLEHQWRESSQKLYPRCTGIDPDTLMKCSNTVHDIFSGISLCPKHSAESAVLGKRKAVVHSGSAPKKPKVGASKAVRERKGVALQSKGSPPVKTKAAVLPVDLKAPPLAGAWSSGGDSDEPTSSSTTTLPVAEGCKPVVSSKSLDDLLTLGSSLSAPLPKLDLLPLKADIGEIMMAGEDSSGDE